MSSTVEGEALKVIASTTSRYRRMPRLNDISLGPASSEARQKRCDRVEGHVLQLQHGGRVICIRCDAEWRDDGF